MWILVVITLIGQVPHTQYYPAVDKMSVCFEMREAVIERLGRPVINYQAVCVQHAKSA